MNLEHSASRTPAGDVEAAVTHAAEALTRIDSDGFMATRVVARLGEQRSSRRRWPLAAAAAIGGAAIVWTVIYVNRSAPGNNPTADRWVGSTPLPSSTAPNPSVASTSTGAAVVSAIDEPSVPMRRSLRAAAAATAAESAVSAAWRARALPPLAQPEPLRVEDNQPEPLVVPLLQLKPIATAPIELSRLGGGRNATAP